MNKILLTGRLVKDSELNYIGATGTPKMSFSLAVERNYQKDKNNKKVDFINMEMIGQHTEKLSPYVTKGKAILVEGELNIDNYEKDGERRSFTKVKVDRLEFLASNSNNENKNTTSDFGNFQEVGSDEDIPFQQAGVRGMSNFNYNRYSEIVEKLNSLANVLTEANEDNYMSFKVQDTLCRVIQEANRVNTYIRHYKDKQGKYNNV